VVKKIADEHGARVRIANLSTPSRSDPGGVLARGAQVSLSFSKLAPATAAKAVAPTAASEAH
jgi:nitrogen fixation/metabolism regulation signal transduction histidine kinase